MSLNEAFLADILDVCSKFFKELHQTCEKHKSPNYKPEDDSDDEKKKAKKPKKKVIDPLKEDNDAPKKPIIQGYLLYYTDVRAQRQKEHPKLLNKDLTKLIAEEWNKLPKDKKESYEIKARVNRQQYDKDLEDYFKRKPHMREVVNQAKNSGKRPPQSTEGSVTGEAAHKKPSNKVLASSSDEEDDDAQMKSPSPQPAKPTKKLTKLANRKKSFSDDSDSDNSDDSDDSVPIKKLKVT